jgi:hypothetical protein
MATSVTPLRVIGTAQTDLDALLPRWRELTPERQSVLLALAHDLGRTALGGCHRMLAALNDYLDGDSEAALDRAGDELRHSYPRYAEILRANRA